MALPPCAVQYWRDRLGAAATPAQIEVFTRFDVSLWRLHEVESAHHVFELLAPGGELQGTRKLWSYYGAIRRQGTNAVGVPVNIEANPYDAGNWYYATVLRSYAYCSSRSCFHEFRFHLSDVLLGDIIEAVLGMAWTARQGSAAGHNMEVPLHPGIVQQYVDVIEECVRSFQAVSAERTRLGHWLSSPDEADWFCDSTLRARVAGLEWWSLSMSGVAAAGA